MPDIIVTKPDLPEIELMVEVKATVGDVRATEAQLKLSMIRRNCPIGMFVTPESILFFRNRYTSYELESVQKMGECRTNELLDAMPDKALVSESYLISRVEQWLESLPLGGRRRWPSSAQDAIESFILPAVADGVVRADGPRFPRTGS